MEFIVIFSLLACIVWLVMKLRAEKKETKKAKLNEAWRTVLNDPEYIHRRRYEERVRAEEEQARKAEGL
jgi:hypothetical protein